MKVFYIDKNNKKLRIMDKLVENGLENVELKDSYNFRCTKNDFVILTEYNEKDENNVILNKYNNLIVITNKIDENTIWKLANEYHTKDVISSKCDEDYIAKRISKFILNKSL